MKLIEGDVNLQNMQIKKQILDHLTLRKFATSFDLTIYIKKSSPRFNSHWVKSFFFRMKSLFGIPFRNHSKGFPSKFIFIKRTDVLKTPNPLVQNLSDTIETTMMKVENFVVVFKVPDHKMSTRLVFLFIK